MNDIMISAIARYEYWVNTHTHWAKRFSGYFGSRGEYDEALRQHAIKLARDSDMFNGDESEEEDFGWERLNIDRGNHAGQTIRTDIHPSITARWNGWTIEHETLEAATPKTILDGLDMEPEEDAQLTDKLPEIADKINAALRELREP